MKNQLQWKEISIDMLDLTARGWNKNIIEAVAAGYVACAKDGKSKTSKASFIKKKKTFVSALPFLPRL